MGGNSSFISFVFLLILAVSAPLRGQEPSSDAGQKSSVELKTAVAADAKEGVTSGGAASTEATQPITFQKALSEFFSSPLSYMLLVLIAFYAFLIIPQQRAARKAQRETAERLNNLKKNDRVVTTAGIHGIISSLNSESGTVTIRLDENSNAKMTVDRTTIRSVSKEQ